MNTTKYSRGVPQGSIISALFCNKDFHQLDLKIAVFKKQFDVGVKRLANSEFTKIMNKQSFLEELEKQIVSKYPQLKSVIINMEQK